MDPFSAICNVVTAYITFATARFNAMPPAQQAELGAIDAAIIKTMYDDAVKVRETLSTFLVKPSWPIHPSTTTVPSKDSP